MAVRLTVALAGDPKNWTGGLQHPRDWIVPYVDRPKVEVSAGEGERIVDVLNRAAEMFGVVPIEPYEGAGPFPFGGPAFIAFYRADQPNDIGRLHREVILVDEQGRARWVGNWHAEPIAEYVRAGDAGVLYGDPRRPYLLLQPGVGNGLLADWPTFLELLKLSWLILSGIATVEGVAALRDRLRRLSEQGSPSAEVTESLYEQWKANGARPDTFDALLGVRPWHVQDLADLLGCTHEQAEAVLIGFGHERDSVGLWRPGRSEDSKLLRGNVEFIVHAGMNRPRDEVEQVLRDRAETFVRTGKTPELDWSWPSTLGQRLRVAVPRGARAALHRLRRIARRR